MGANQAPLFVGIAGGSGSGKTTIADALLEAVPGVALLQHDAYYRDRRDLAFDQRSRLNYDHPDSLETALLIRHLDLLARGVSIQRPVYDFSVHLRAPEVVRVEPAKVVLVEGILVLADKALRERLDLKIYVDTDPDLRLARRLERDISERGRTVDSVLAQYFESVRPMHLEFVEPSKRYADLIMPEGYNPRAVETVVEMLRARLVAVGELTSPA